MTTKTVQIRGPYFWRNNPSVFECEYANDSGIYLWSVGTEQGELIYYVGESDKFSRRLNQHLKAYLAGKYQFHEPEGFVGGVKRQIWPGAWRPRDKYKLAEFEKRKEELLPIVNETIDLMRLWLIPMGLEIGMRKRLEGAIAGHLRSRENPVGSFQESDIRYQTRRKDERPVQFGFEGWEKFRGLEESILA